MVVDADIVVGDSPRPQVRQTPPPLPAEGGTAWPGLPSLGDLGERVNHIMYRDGVRGRFATMVCLLLSANSGRVRLLNAGHMAPLILRDLVIEELPRGSIALGMVPVAAYAEQDSPPRRRRHPRGLLGWRHRGDERQTRLLRRRAVPDHPRRGNAAAAAAETGQAVVDAVTRFVGDAPVHDDVSLVVIRRRH